MAEENGVVVQILGVTADLDVNGDGLAETEATLLADERAKKPKRRKPRRKKKREDKNCNGPGSVIRCQSQTLGERLGLTGTPFTLVYESDRTAGRREAYTVDLAVGRRPVGASPSKSSWRFRWRAVRSWTRSRRCPT